jgi:hypothetical protein
VDAPVLNWIADKFDYLLGIHSKKIWDKYSALTMAQFTFQVIESNDAGAQQSKVDANGNASILVYSNRTHRNLVIGRVVVNVADGTAVNMATPHMGGANEWAGIFGGPGANLASARSLYPFVKQGQLFPLVDTWPGHNALRFRGSEDVYFELRGSSLPVGTPLVVTIYGNLEPVGSDCDW